MKQAKLLIALVIIAILLGGYIMFFEIGSKPGEGTTRNVVNKDKAFFTDVKRVEVVAESQKVSFEKSPEGVWFMASPISYPADKDKVAGMLDDIDLAVPDRTIPASDLNENLMREYGLVKPRFTVTIIPKKGDPVSIMIGQKSPFPANSIYAGVSGTKDVYVIRDSVTKNLTDKLDDYRDHKLFDLLPTRTMDLKLTGNIQYSMSYKGGKWAITSPFKAAVATLEGEKAAGSVYGMVVDRFVDDKPSDFAKYGLDTPYESFVATDDQGKAYSLLLGAKVDIVAKPDLGDAYYAKTLDRPNVFTVQAAKVAEIKTDPLGFVDLKLSGIAYTDVNRLTVVAPSGEVDIEKSGTDLKFKKPEEGEADGDATDEFFKLLAEVSAIKVMLLAGRESELGIDGKLVLNVNPGTDGALGTFRLEIGRYSVEEKGWYVRRNDEGVALLVADEKLRRVAEVSRYDFITRHIKKFKSDEAFFLSISGEPQSASFTKRDKDWTCDNKPEAKPDSAKIKEVLVEFEDIKPTRTFAYSAERAAEFGFDAPRAKIVVSVKTAKADEKDKTDTSTVTIVFGKDAPGEAKGVYAYIEGEKYAVIVPNTLYQKLYEKYLIEAAPVKTPGPDPAQTLGPAPAVSASPVPIP
ncbi:MAG: DUF4340 domain-containing protein [Candidatus Brocadiia bacterium]